MAPGQIPHPTRNPKHPFAPRPDEQPRHIGMLFPNPKDIYAFRNPMILQRYGWIESAKDQFHQLILFGERQPSIGTVRRVERPDGKTRFAVAYGSALDLDLQFLLTTIYDLHREVDMVHDSRDSTGKHWIKCFTKVQPGSLERPIEKAVICVSSKLELATIPMAGIEEAAGNGNGKASDEKKEWPPKVPGAMSWAPDHLYFLPWYRQLTYLKPAAAPALRERMEAKFSESGGLKWRG